jgi:two-component system LytT family response regulator
MNCEEKIKTVIIDDDKNFIFDLKEHLLLYPEVDLLGYASHYKQAKSLLLNEHPDLVFLDVEMPVKNGFELLNEVRELAEKPFNVIFYTAYDTYMIQALRESALDYILKPVKSEELKDAIERFKRKEQTTQTPDPNYQNILGFPEMISLPTSTGMKFVDKKNIVMFQSSKESLLDRQCWEALLNDMSHIKLRKGITSNEIQNLLGSARCIKINQSTIVNLNYLSVIEFKTRECFLVPPFNNIPLIVSRNNLVELREKFDFI